VVAVQRLFFGLIGAASCTAMAAGGFIARSRSVDAAALSASAAAAEAPLRPPKLACPTDFGVHRVMIDAGHGAEKNRGNLSCFCVDEQDFTFAAAEWVAARLEATGHFEVRRSREGGAEVAYPNRLDDAEAFDAEVFVSLHSDVRGHAGTWAPEAGRSCPVAPGGAGFSVLYADEGEPELVARRLALSRALAARMLTTGFAPYAGGYADLYAADPAPGVFVDRHAPGQRIFVLRRASMPSVILETHNALDPGDADRWTAPETLDAAADALAAALVDVLGRGPGVAATAARQRR